MGERNRNKLEASEEEDRNIGKSVRDLLWGCSLTKFFPESWFEGIVQGLLGLLRAAYFILQVLHAVQILFQVGDQIPVPKVAKLLPKGRCFLT